MTLAQSLYHTYQRYRSLQTDTIRALPLVILMPHSACNCRCVMCDIWKDNKNLKQLTEQDIRGLLTSLKKLGTQQVLMSGGEALLNPNFFRFCEMLNREHISVTLLSTGLTLKKNAAAITRYVRDVIVSLDGDETMHDRIRQIPGAFRMLREGVEQIKTLSPAFRVTARSVIHRINFRSWPAIIESAANMGLDQVSFLPADVSSHAFNREVLWSEKRQHEILPAESELEEMQAVLEHVLVRFADRIRSGFIAEFPAKLKKIVAYYAACYGHQPFPYKKCNAPWVSAVVEADGTLRPCFFHDPVGNIRQDSLENILNGDKATRFRKELDLSANETCKKCVCYLHLSPGINLNQ